MPLILSRTAKDVVAEIQLLDDGNDRVPSIPYDDVLLQVEGKAAGDNSYSAITLKAGTVGGDYDSGSWVHVDDGKYELSVPNNLIVPGKQSVLRAKYDANNWRYLSILPVAGDEAETTTAPIDDTEQTNATAQWPNAAVNTVGTSIEYKGDKWVLAFGPVEDGIPNGEEIVFSLKSSKTDTDGEAILAVSQTLGQSAGTPGLVVLNGAAGTSSQGSLIYDEAWVDPSDGVTKSRVVVTVADDATALIAAGNYYRGLKRVGESNVMIDDVMEVLEPPYQEITP